jgi:hypothetical protein
MREATLANPTTTATARPSVEMRTYFNEKPISLGASGTEFILAPFKAVRFYAVTGTILVRMNDGSWLTCREGSGFDAMPREAWGKMEFKSVAGGSLEVVYGLGTFGNPTGGSVTIDPGSVGTGSPEGVVTAPAGKTYYDTANNDFYVKASGAGNTGWQAIVDL